MIVILGIEWVMSNYSNIYLKSLNKHSHFNPFHFYSPSCCSLVQVRLNRPFCASICTKHYLIVFCMMKCVINRNVDNNIRMTAQVDDKTTDKCSDETRCSICWRYCGK